MFCCICCLSFSGGLEGEKDYPYMADGEKCKFKSDKVKVSISDSVSLPQDETKLASWLAKNGPISIGINANMMQVFEIYDYLYNSKC